MQSYNAQTNMDGNNNAVSVNIGVSEIYHVKHRFPYLKSPSVQDEDFARVILNMYHEDMHVIQKNQMFRENNLSEYEHKQLIQEIACMGSSVYYLQGGNYKHNANEIQAEQHGIVKCYEYLKHTFSHKDSKQLESIVLNVVNDKMMNTSYFVHQSEPFTSLSDVEAAFDDAYIKSFSEPRSFFRRQ